MNISPTKKIALIIGLMLGHQVVLAGYKAVDGGTGTNTLVITASGVNDLSYFPTINLTDSTLTLADASGGTINDIIGMSGFDYSDLTVEKGTGDYSNHVIVKKIDAGEFLTIIKNSNITDIDDNDFSAI